MCRTKALERQRNPVRLLLISSALALSSPAIAQACPPQGQTNQRLALALNPLKNRDDAPLASQFDPNATLQAVLAPGPDLNRWSHGHGAILEGVVVHVKRGGKESANCGATDAPHQDTHIELALSPSAPKSQHVIVEVTPRWRDKMAVIADWSTAALRQQLLGHRVRVAGWLFDDLEHVGQSENTHPGAAGNWRATVWEIHPITGIVVLPGAAMPLNAAVTSTPLVRVTHHRHRAKRPCGHSRTHACRNAHSSGHPPTK